MEEKTPADEGIRQIKPHCLTLVAAARGVALGAAGGFVVIKQPAADFGGAMRVLTNGMKYIIY